MPIMKRACEWACGSEESEAVLSIARLLGRICHELKGEDGPCFFSLYVMCLSSNRFAVESIVSPGFTVDQR